MNQILEVTDLTVGFYHKKELVPVVSSLSLQLGEGEILGIVGESGSGKSMTAHAILGLLPEQANLMSGSIRFCGTELIGTKKRTMQEIRGSQISMIFQEPMTSLNPLLCVGEQIEEMLRLHEHLEKEEYHKQTLQAMEEAGLTDCENLYHKYPHQLSGGMRQRAMIAMAMIAKPKLLIADEPTTALDVSIQEKILDLLLAYNKKYHTSILFISHDLSVIRYLCHRAIVLKQGRVVEEGDIETLFTNPKQEETRELIQASPALWYQKHASQNDKGNLGTTSVGREQNSLMSVCNFSVSYPESSRHLFAKKTLKTVVHAVNFELLEGETLGIVGESGSGKSTLAKAIVGLNENITGEVVFYSKNLMPQMVFQDPYSSLNPVKKVGWILEEPLKNKKKLSKQERREAVARMIEEVGLTKQHVTRYISELSGGQRQRVAIALALMLNARLVVLDEPVSALDVTIQAQILRLLKELKEKYQLSYLFISHDLNVVYQICDRVLVMKDGHIVEQGATMDIFEHPREAYTMHLLHASRLQAREK